MEPTSKTDTEIVIHDSCIHVRCKNVIEEPRELLKHVGYRIKEPKDSKALTHCCGGTIESIFPKTANQIGEKRVEQLKDTKAQSVALMCPICLATLKKAAQAEIGISDISTLLAKVYCNGQLRQGRST